MVWAVRYHASKYAVTPKFKQIEMFFLTNSDRHKMNYECTHLSYFLLSYFWNFLDSEIELYIFFL